MANIEIKEFRTYHRRKVTRYSGYHVAGDHSGGECLILKATRFNVKKEKNIFEFYKKSDEFMDLFCRKIGMLAFAAYIKVDGPATIICRLNYNGSNSVENEIMIKDELNPNIWNSIGFNKQVSLINKSDFDISDILVELEIISKKNAVIQIISVDMGTVKSDYYSSKSDHKEDTEKFWKYFNQKTSLAIPHIYYFDAELPIETYLLDNGETITEGDPVVLKSCNRCSRYLPINIENELNTAAFALHCKKRAPCTHSTFSKYKIDNIEELDDDIINYFKNLKVFFEEDGIQYIRSYYGHQLECKPCKKYFVNACLNPMRNTQQFREDGLRRRALEVLVDTLLDRELVHHEFRRNNKKEFSDYIWNKFGGKCFKCGKSITSAEMNLDHTMPLAFLYRLDESATCLCDGCNSQKSDHFPVDYYTDEELDNLSEITGLSLTKLKSKQANQDVVKLLRENIVWFFDEFLNEPDYQKVRDGKLTADKIYAALVRVTKINLLEDYVKATKKYPLTISTECK